MAGSIDWFDYSSENGARYAVRVDKSNGFATINGVSLMNARAAGAGGIPCNVKKRYVNAYSASNPKIRRKFWVGNFDAIVQITNGGNDILAEDYSGADNAPGLTRNWVVTSYRGEKSTTIPSPGSQDTGLNDAGV